MSFQRRYPLKRKPTERMVRTPDINELVHPESTGTEASYFKSLIESHKKVTINLNDGEKVQGYIRYYDRYCFSVGLLNEKRKIFLRKESVSSISEDLGPSPKAPNQGGEDKPDNREKKTE